MASLLLLKNHFNRTFKGLLHTQIQISRLNPARIFQCTRQLNLAGRPKFVRGLPALFPAEEREMLSSPSPFSLHSFSYFFIFLLFPLPSSSFLLLFLLPVPSYSSSCSLIFLLLFLHIPPYPRACGKENQMLLVPQVSGVQIFTRTRAVNTFHLHCTYGSF